MAALSQLQQALVDLRNVAPQARGRLIQACAAAISTDSQVTLQEAELLRGIADLLGCPMPPLLPGEASSDNEQIAAAVGFGIA